MDNNIQTLETVHKELCAELHNLYVKKNSDYGNSFHKTFLEEGFSMPRVRLADKLERFKTLTRKPESAAPMVNESIRDTLVDLANYALMTVMEIDLRAKNEMKGNRASGIYRVVGSADYAALKEKERKSARANSQRAVEKDGDRQNQELEAHLAALMELLRM